MTDTPEVRPPLEPVAIADVVAESLDRFVVQLSAGTFRVDVSVPPTLPQVLGDRTGLASMLDNLVDNVIRHSRGERALAIGASVSGRFVVLEVGDRAGDSAGRGPARHQEVLSRPAGRPGSALASGWPLPRASSTTTAGR